MSEFDSSRNKVIRQISIAISAEGKKHAADRVVYFSQGYKFSGFDPLDVENNIKGLDIDKIKFQKKIDGKYIDVSVYKKLTDFFDLIDDACYPGDIYLLDKKKYFYWLKREFYRAVFANNKLDLSLISDLENKIRNYSDKNSVFVSSYLSCLRLGLYENDNFGWGELDVDDPESAAQVLLRGCYVSKCNRSVAEAMFEKVRLSRNADLFSWYGADSGVNTYFSLTDADYDDAKNKIASINNFIVPYFPKNASAIIISLDVRFFKIYFPLLGFVAHHAADVDFHIFLVGGGFDEVVSWSDQYRSLLQDLTEISNKSNVFFQNIPVPDYVYDAKTFYACARYMYASKALANYRRVYIMDADLIPKDDFVSYIDKLQDGCWINKNVSFTSLWPWRRVMGGNMAFVGEQAEVFLKHMIAYILKGLSIPGSWMLDQNAALYASENSECSLLKNIPFVQLPVRCMWERGVR